jgi:quinohemoprotein amine dehydrogenase
MKIRQAVFWIAAALAGTSIAVAQTRKDDVETETGIPVTDRLVLEKCGTCHRPDDKGNLSRISWMRTTPEGWAQTVKRMVALNGLSITPEQSRAVVRSLSATHGLAPEEAMPVAYIPEKRIIDEFNIPNDQVREACAACHAFGQGLSWRRSKFEWKALQEFHVALYSQAGAQFRRTAGASGERDEDEENGGRRPPDNGEVALDYMRKTAPLHTPEWASWSARRAEPRLAGTWLLTASLPGKGPFVGTVEIEPGALAEEFNTTTTMRSLVDGSIHSRSGAGLVYGGFMWRGRSDNGGRVTAPDDPLSSVRETLHFTPDQQSATGRWFWGEYHEFGYDVKLVRATAAPAILAVTPGAIRAGSRGVELTVWGRNLPVSGRVPDVRLGSGVSVRDVVSAAPDKLVVTVDVDESTPSGPRDVAIGGAVLEKAIPVYSNVDFIKVTPETAMARLGGIRFPKGFQQFEAVGFENGPDGKPNTADDIAIGPIEADWSIEEFPTVYYDDDVRFVGELSQSALFTPAVEGPNDRRRFGRNNYGEVWVVAKAKSETDDTGQPLTGRAYLVVTVPSYQRWDQPELSE